MQYRTAPKPANANGSQEGSSLFLIKPDNLVMGGILIEKVEISSTRCGIGMDSHYSPFMTKTKLVLLQARHIRIHHQRDQFLERDRRLLLQLSPLFGRIRNK